MVHVKQLPCMEFVLALLGGLLYICSYSGNRVYCNYYKCYAATEETSEDKQEKLYKKLESIYDSLVLHCVIDNVCFSRKKCTYMHIETPK